MELCYGDSLTAGFYANGKHFSPYGNALREALDTLGFQCEVSICGLSGHRADEMVAELSSPMCRDMCGKIGKGLAHILDNDGPYDLVILMAGTNDFVPNVNLQSIKSSVCKLHDACHIRGVPTVMLTAPINTQHMRVGLCGLLKDWASKQSRVLAFVDPEDVMPRSKRACWEPDQVHFAPAGSRALGLHLASTITPILRRLGQKPGRKLGTSTAPSHPVTSTPRIQGTSTAPSPLGTSTALRVQANLANMVSPRFHKVSPSSHQRMASGPSRTALRPVHMARFGA